MKEKFGKIVEDLILKDMQTDVSQQHNMHDQTDAMLSTFDEEVYRARDHATGKMTCTEFNSYQRQGMGCNPVKCKPFMGDFFIEVIQYKPKLFPNTINQMIIARKSCPTPNYDQIVFQWDSKLEQLVEVWVIGSRLTCFYFMQNTKEMKPEFNQLFDYIQRFANGDLFRLCKQLNNEKDDTPELNSSEVFTTH